MIKKEKVVIVGLSNPGSEYDRTLHNIGKVLVQYLADNLDWKVSKYKAFVELMTDEYSVVLVYSNYYYMNDHGLLIRSLIDHDKLIVVHDEVSYKPGIIKWKYGGSARGHNGLRSIVRYYGEGFWKMGVGVGQCSDDGDLARYLTKPVKEDLWQMVINGVYKVNIDMILSILGNKSNSAQAIF